MLSHAWMTFHNMAFWLMLLFWGLIAGGIVLCLFLCFRNVRSGSGQLSKDQKGDSHPEKSSPL